MNRREKRMLIATGSLVSVWLLSLLLGGDSKSPPTAEAETPAAAASTSQATPPQKSPARAETAPVAASQADTASVFTLSAQHIDRVVMAARMPRTELMAADPFRELAPPAPVAPVVENVELPPLPTLAGVFHSADQRGALMDGRVCFEGDSIGDFVLGQVHKDSVTLRFGSREIQLSYEPHRATQSSSGTQQEKP